MIDVEDAIRQRIDAILSSDPDLVLRYRLYESDYGDVGLLTIMNRDKRVIGFELFESDESWKRPNAANEYNSASGENYPISVVVPDRSVNEFNDRIRGAGGRGFSIYRYSDLNLAPRIRA